MRRSALTLALVLAAVAVFVAAAVPARASHVQRGPIAGAMVQIGRAVTYMRGSGRLAGTPADDTIDARNGRRDTVTCGGGRDTVLADRFDRVDRTCERVVRS